MIRPFRALPLLALSFLATTAGFIRPAAAAGFYIQEQSVSGLGAAFAGQAAMPRDASILYFNPGGLARLDGAQLNIGVHLIAPTLDMVDTGTALNSPGVAFGFPPGQGIGTADGGNPGSLTPVPNLYIAAPVTEDNALWLGFGLSAPFGLGSQYNSDFFARFDSTESDLQTLDFQPTVAWRVNDWFSAGATLIVEYADANLKSIAAVPVPNGAPPPAFFVVERESVLRGDDVSLGGNIGIMITPCDDTTIGIDYRTTVKHKLEGQVSLAGILNSPGSADLNLPDIAAFGIAHEFGPRWTGLAQASWFGWNSFDAIEPFLDDGTPLAPVPQNYQTTWAYAIGAEYKASDEWALRAGYQFDETPTTDEFRTTRTPDGDRHWFAAGATYAWDDRLSFDIGATYINVEEEDINLQRGTGADIITVSTRTDDAWIGILSLGVNYKF